MNNGVEPKEGELISSEDGGSILDNPDLLLQQFNH